MGRKISKIRDDRGKRRAAREPAPDDPDTSEAPDMDAADQPRTPERFDRELDESRMDSDAAKVVRRLVRHGHEAYLVGGCVRDLLLDQRPKDFDVATSARPEVVRRLFRNSRIIGRRFRLVHVLFSGGKVIETATFRCNPSADGKANTGNGNGNGSDLLIRDDNTFGRADEDALRRDFTINALFYDLECSQVLDWCGGMKDIDGRAVRIIGDPYVRFREDPVRMLRAIKFAARLDLGIVPEVYHAMENCGDCLALAARPRLLEEVLRLLRGGAARRSYWLAWETGLLDVLLPELSAYLFDSPEDMTWSILREVDRLHAERDEPLDDAVLLCALLLEPLQEACGSEHDRVAAAFDFLEPIVERLSIPRRISDAMRRIMAMLPRLAAGRPGRFARSALYPLANEVFQIGQAACNEPLPEPEVKPRRRHRRRRRSQTVEDLT